MLRNSFIHIPGVGRMTERKLWARGICDWADATESIKSEREGLGALAHKLRTYIPRTLTAFETRDAAFFQRLSAFGESWRVYDEFADQSVFLDIETTGLSASRDKITVVGLYNGREYKPFVSGHNLQTLGHELRKYSVAITFNGNCFDMAFLRRSFRSSLPPLHIDLRWTAYRLGIKGGLKEIEPRFGLRRAKKVSEIDGFDAIILWKRFQRGDKSALDLLIEYNRADVVNLRPIMEQCFNRLVEQHSKFLKTGKRRAAAAR